MGVTCLQLRSEDAHFRSPSPREQIQMIGVFVCLFFCFCFLFLFFGFLGKKLFTPAACPEPDLTAGLSVVLELLLSMLVSDTVYQSPARDPEL